MLKPKLVSYMVFGFGLFLLILGISIGISWPFIFMNILRDKMQLQNTTETYKLWVKTPIPMYLELYLFNWTNSKEFMKNKSVIPNLEEVGPFVFKEVHDRVNITWNNNNTVTFNQTRTWTFVPDLSLDLSTEVTNLNVVATTVAYLTRFSPFSRIINEILKMEDSSLFVTKPAREWLFDGMEDYFLSFMDRIRKYINIPIPYNKFGFFYERNLSSSYDGVFTIKTGADDIYNLGEMDSWNYVNQTNFYEGQCAMVNGTSGELFPPMKEFKKEVSAFISDMCSTVTLNYLERVSVESVPAYKYVGEASIFDNGTLYPEKSCFCVGECLPSGVLNVSACRGAPIFMSFPHFYLADPVYTKSISGMKPNKTEHQFILSLDPVTGVPLEVRAQFQVNLLLRPNSFGLFKDVPKIFVPMVWFRQRAKITPELAKQALLLSYIDEGGAGLTYGIATTGILMIFIRLIIVIHRKKETKETGEREPLISPSITEGN